MHPELPGLYFIGFFDVTGGSNIRMMDDQADYISAVAAGAVTLPVRSDMARIIAEDFAWYEKQFPDSPRYGNELDPLRYRAALAADYARCNVAKQTYPDPGYVLHAEVTP